jgi:predicted site-specific integrase-resolvase
MTTRTNAPARVDRAGQGRGPELITHRKVAGLLGISCRDIRRWVAKGSFPMPHASVEVTWFYREDVIRAFLETGKWPEGVRFQRTRGGEAE